MNSKEIFIIILLLLILALVYKLMQSTKMQSELVGGMAVKMGVAIKKPRRQQEEENETEEGEGEIVDDEEEEEQEEEEEEQKEEKEKKEKGEEILETREEDQHGNPIESGLEHKSVVLKVTKPNKQIESPKKKRSKLKGYEKIIELLDTPLKIGELKNKWRETFGQTDDEKIVYNLNYALSRNMINKHPVGKRFLYGRLEMFDGDKLKEEFLPKTESEKE